MGHREEGVGGRSICIYEDKTKDFKWATRRMASRQRRQCGRCDGEKEKEKEVTWV